MEAEAQVEKVASNKNQIQKIENYHLSNDSERLFKVINIFLALVFLSIVLAIISEVIRLFLA